MLAARQYCTAAPTQYIKMTKRNEKIVIIRTKQYGKIQQNQLQTIQINTRLVKLQDKSKPKKFLNLSNNQF